MGWQVVFVERATKNRGGRAYTARTTFATQKEAEDIARKERYNINAPYYIVEESQVPNFIQSRTTEALGYDPNREIQALERKRLAEQAKEKIETGKQISIAEQEAFKAKGGKIISQGKEISGIDYNISDSKRGMVNQLVQKQGISRRQAEEIINYESNIAIKPQLASSRESVYRQILKPGEFTPEAQRAIAKARNTTIEVNPTISIGEQPELRMPIKSRYENAISDLIEQEKGFAQRIERSKDIFRAIPVLRGDSLAQQLGREILALPTTLTVTAGEYGFISGGKAALNILGYARKETRESTKEESFRALKATPEAAVGAFNPMTPSGIVNLGLIIVPGITAGKTFSLSPTGKFQVLKASLPSAKPFIPTKGQPIIKEGTILSETIVPKTEPVQLKILQRSAAKPIPTTKMLDVKIYDIPAASRAAQAKIAKVATSNLGQSIIQTAAPIAGFKVPAFEGVAFVLKGAGRRTTKMQLIKQSFDAQINPNQFFNRVKGEVGLRIRSPELKKGGIKERVIARQAVNPLIENPRSSAARITSFPTGNQKAGITTKIFRDEGGKPTLEVFRETGTVAKPKRLQPSQTGSEFRQANRAATEFLSGNTNQPLLKNQLMIIERKQLLPSITRGQVPQKALTKIEQAVVNKENRILQIAERDRAIDQARTEPFKVIGGFRKGIRERLMERIRQKTEMYTQQQNFQLVGQPYSYDFILPPQAKKLSLGLNLLPSVRAVSELKPVGTRVSDLNLIKPTIRELTSSIRRSPQITRSLNERVVSQSRRNLLSDSSIRFAPITRAINIVIPAYKIGQQQAQEQIISPITAQEQIQSPEQIFEQPQIQEQIFTPNIPTSFNPPFSPQINIPSSPPGTPTGFPPRISPPRNPPRRPPTKIPPLFKPPRLPPKISQSQRLGRITTTSLTPAYNVLIKRTQQKIGKGKYVSRGYVKANKEPLTKDAASGLGASIVDQYANRSFKIQIIKGIAKKRADLENTWSALRYKFYSAKTSNTLVEKSAFAIDSPTEVQNIPYEAIRQRKAQKMRFL